MEKYTPKLPKAVIEYEVRDKNGKLIEKGKFPAKSWVGNIVGLLSAIISMWLSADTTRYATSASRADLTDVSGTARGISISTATATGGATLGGSAPTGDTTAGIVLGSSDTPVSLSQYSLGALIPHGTASGQLLYGPTTVESLSKDTTWLFRIVRTFTNSSGASVTVREIGLYVRLGMSSSPYYYSCMFARDVPTSPISVPNGSTLTVRYIISHSLS
jgi:hypothetical protein